MFCQGNPFPLAVRVVGGGVVVRAFFVTATAHAAAEQLAEDARCAHSSHFLRWCRSRIDCAERLGGFLGDSWATPSAAALLLTSPRGPAGESDRRVQGRRHLARRYPIGDPNDAIVGAYVAERDRTRRVGDGWEDRLFTVFWPAVRTQSLPPSSRPVRTVSPEPVGVVVVGGGAGELDPSKAA